MRRNTTLMAVAVVALLGAACGGKSSPSSTPPPTQATGGSPSASAPCSGSSTSVSITAKNIAFVDTLSRQSLNCLAVPANQAFTIDLDNQDSGTRHTVSIYTDSSGSQALFKGDPVTGPAMHTYMVSALQAGTFFFRCDIHPTRMFGTFVVGP